jgi:long-chain acyl-CoA synthetase
MKSLGAFLEELAAQYGPRPALQYKPGDETQVWTYNDLLERANRVAFRLKEHGIEKGDRVVLWAPNSPTWVASFFGMLRVGAVVVPLDVASGPDFVRRILDLTEPKFAVLSTAARAEWSYPIPAALIEEMEKLPETREPLPDAGINADDIAEIVFTAGTTGDPKGVIITHGNMLADLEAANQYVPATPRFRTVSILPLSHVLEQNVGMLLAMKRGASIFYLASRQPATIFAALTEHGATTMILVPQLLQLFMAAIEREVKKQGKEKAWQHLLQVAEHMPQKVRRLMFRSVHERLGGMLDFLVTGGAPIDPGLIHKWELLGVPIIQGYGATEAAGVIAATPMHDRNPYTVGPPIPGLQMKIAPDGEVLLKGPNMSPGYWRNPKATEEAFEDGWYKTGDLGHFDDKGRLYLHGRKKDMIVLSSGQKVYPQDVEQVLLAIEGVADAVVVGMPSEQGQQVYAVLIFKTDAATRDPEAVIRQANPKLATSQRIRGASGWPDAEFPRTFTLKVKKHEVLKRLLEMEAANPKSGNHAPELASQGANV